MLWQRMNVGRTRLIRCSWHATMGHASSRIEIFGSTFGASLLHRTILRRRHRVAFVFLRKKQQFVLKNRFRVRGIIDDLPMVECYRLSPNSCAIYHTDRAMLVHYFSHVPCDGSLHSRRCCRTGPGCCSCPHPENCWTLPLSSSLERSVNQSVGSPNLFLFGYSNKNKLFKRNKIESNRWNESKRRAQAGDWQRDETKNKWMWCDCVDSPECFFLDLISAYEMFSMTKRPQKKQSTLD